MQTLHPYHFDQGRILAQTPEPGFKHGCKSVEQLSQYLGERGADLLVNCIQNQVFSQGPPDSSLPQADEVEKIRLSNKSRGARPAPKITSEDRLVDWSSMTAEQILRRHRVIGPLWSFLGSKDFQESTPKRVIWTRGFSHTTDVAAEKFEVARPTIVSQMGSEQQKVYVRTCDDQVLQIHEITIEGQPALVPIEAAKKACVLGKMGNGHLFNTHISFPFKMKFDTDAN